MNRSTMIAGGPPLGPVATLPAATDDAVLAALFDAARELAAGEVHLEMGRTYQVTRPVNARRLMNMSVYGHNATIVGRFGPEHAKCPVVDTTGSRLLYVCDLDIQGHGRGPPACGALTARANPDSSNGNVFERVTIGYGTGGYFGVAAVVNIGGEGNVWDKCFLRATVTEGGDVYGYWTSSWNERGVESPHGPVYGGHSAGGGGAVSNAHHTIVDSAITVDGVGGKRSNIYLGARTVAHQFRGLCLTNKLIADTRGEAFVIFGEGVNPEKDRVFDAMFDSIYIEPGRGAAKDARPRWGIRKLAEPMGTRIRDTRNGALPLTW